MKKQKICIIGGGLTGLLTASVLSKFNLKIDIVIDNFIQNIKTNRTTAISYENINYLKKINLFKFSDAFFWPASQMKIYSNSANENLSEILDIPSSPPKKILYMVNNSKFIKNLLGYIKSNKSITIKRGKKISSIFNAGLLKGIRFKNKNKDEEKYNLIIVCVGKNSDLSNSLFKDNTIKRSYEEVSVTTILKHSKLKNTIARQIFIKAGVLAFLPLSYTKTSVVLSIKKKTISSLKEKRNIFIKKKILMYAENFFKSVKFNSNLEFRDLSLLIRKKYYNERILLFGDTLHAVHPLAGQGFNMIIRDLANLEKVFKNKLKLGLDIGNQDTLLEFSKSTKSKNFIYSMGIDFVRNIFLLENKNFKNVRNQIIRKINKDNTIKSFIVDIANRGI